ncbi:CTP synthase [Candidatus Endolissoclinum faulkneri L5]|uniref:CTP synthase n=1 Tax=Candidatus Endolissoclinum faulkneri L5 TaxID=1401328 RepID=V9TSK9_9PROT|nr:CTP synthase [Candidatus Endolissoclinum faulkneri]AHC73581.1 CTP synthase [Candidatus Endolissoclinum faulkneri L5]
MTRFIFITGGVVSSLGKGIATATLGALLQARGYTVRLRKLDPYLNVDPGTMSPYQHGEVYVTDDGVETDLDLGHYERFTGVSARKSDSITTGQIYMDVITRERRGDYLGATIQVIPHVTDAIKEFIRCDITEEDFVLCEIGGTVGDIEGLPFLEAIRQLGNELGHDNSLRLHLTLLPHISSTGELKTKPTQHSVKELQSMGIQPDILLCRCNQYIPIDQRCKIGQFCNIRPEAVITALDALSIYEVPLRYHDEGLDTEVLRYFSILREEIKPSLARWTGIMDRVSNPEGQVKIAVIGKYTSLLDSYKSLAEALIHGGIANKVRVELDWINSEMFEKESESFIRLNDVNGILVPGGFGERGSEGKIAAVTFARERRIPYFGICFGMQMACIEAARSGGGLLNASSSEFGPCDEPVVGLLTEWINSTVAEIRNFDNDYGGTMRLGSYKCQLDKNSRVYNIYGNALIDERHRHRYEVNINYKSLLEKAGLRFAGMSLDGLLPEIIERPDHPWFVGVQFHPELKSKPFDPHPLFTGFIAAAIKQASLV